MMKLLKGKEGTKVGREEETGGREGPGRKEESREGERKQIMKSEKRKE